MRQVSLAEVQSAWHLIDQFAHAVSFALLPRTMSYAVHNVQTLLQNERQ